VCGALVVQQQDWAASPRPSRRHGDCPLDANWNSRRAAADSWDPDPSRNGLGGRATGCHRLPRFGARWLSAEAAAVFDALLVLPSRSTFDAALPARTLVFLPRATVLPFSLDLDAFS